MIIYKVFSKNCGNRRCQLISVLQERRKDLRGKSHLESGLRLARFVLGDLVINNRFIVVVPKIVNEGKEHRLSLSPR